MNMVNYSAHHSSGLRLIAPTSRKLFFIHQISKEPGNYKYSSFHAYTTSKPSVVNPQEVLEWFGGREPFLKYHLIHGEGIQQLPFDIEY
jgi:hypothetical protein